MLLISIKTLEVKWWFLIKQVWSASKEVAEAYGKKHPCLLLENACEACKVTDSQKTLWLADDWPCYPARSVHPLALHSNPPPAWTLWVSYSWKLIYLSSFHWIIIKPLGFARDQSMIAPVVSKSIASLDAAVAYSDKATLGCKESPQQLWIRDRAMFRKWYTQWSIHLSFWVLGQLLKREWVYTQEHCTDTAVPNSSLLVALLQLFSKHRPIDDSLCSVVMPHTPKRAPQMSTSGWKLFWTCWTYSRYFQWERRSSLKPTPLQSTDREKSHVLGCLVQVTDHPEHTRKSAILPKASVWFGFVIQLDLPTLQNGRIRTTLSCNQVPDGLPSFLIFLCSKLSYSKSPSTVWQKLFCYPKNSSGMCLYMAEIEMIKKHSWHRQKEAMGKMRLFVRK